MKKTGESLLNVHMVNKCKHERIEKLCESQALKKNKCVETLHPYHSAVIDCRSFGSLDRLSSSEVQCLFRSFVTKS